MDAHVPEAEIRQWCVNSPKGPITEQPLQV